MDQAAITAYIAETCPGTHVVAGTEGIAAGDTFFIYDPDRNLPDKQQFPFATIVTKDYGEFDNASNLNREGLFRLNVGVSRKTINTVENGVFVPSTILALKLARALDCKVEAIFALDGEQ